MSTQNKIKLISNTGAVIDIMIALAFYVFMAFVLRSHVPSESETQIKLWAAFSAIPLGGTCWFAVSLFHVTLVDYIRNRRN
jgi:hypothetical protein